MTEDSLPPGEEPQAQGNITHLAVLRGGGVSVLSLPNGDIDCSAESATGLYFHDTRYLSRLLFHVEGTPLMSLDDSETEHSLSAVFSNPAIERPNGEVIPAQSLLVRRRRVLADGALLESLTVSNYARRAREFSVSWNFGADFEDIFVIRGYRRLSPPPAAAWSTQKDCATASYRGADGRERTVHLVFSPVPQALDERSATSTVVLAPGETATLQVTVRPGQELRGVTVAEASLRCDDERERWLDQTTGVETDDDDLNEAIRQSLLDLLALSSSIDGRRYTAAGVPWFDTLFGRDGLITGIEMLAFSPEILQSTLTVLAAYQATAFDPMHDAEPGKMPHELRWGELAGAGEVPFGQYYGSVDVTPLFVLALDEYYRWTGDRETVSRLWPNVEAAMDWCRGNLKADAHGFLSYARESSGGLENQGWKDSYDAVLYPDGELASPPIALVEVQAYVAAAFAAYGRLARDLGDVSWGPARLAAGEFMERLDRQFGDAELGYVFALDGRGAQVRTPVSNPGHVLWTGVARPDLARRFVERAFEPDMFTGWGVRTLASTVRGYNPLGYHVGSVWPHDNALLAGLRWYRLDEQADLLGTALLQMAKSFQGKHVPELFSGDARHLRPVPTPYPVASRPQAWSAASVPYVMTSLLGLRPSGANRLFVVAPMLPHGVNLVKVRNLRCLHGSADLTFRRQGGRVSVEVENLRDGLEVVLSSRWPGMPRPRT